jgi:CSLREA domain-containing protein
VVLIAGAAVLAGCEPAMTLTVDSTADAVDVAPGNGVCVTAAGTCTLRAAVQEANASPGPATIELAPGTTYTLQIVGSNEQAAAQGDLDVTDRLTIQGHDAVIDGGSCTTWERIFDNTSELELHELVLRRAKDGLRNRGDLGLFDSRLTESACESWVAIDHDLGVLQVVRSTIDGNNGGVVVFGGEAVILDSTIYGNSPGEIEPVSGPPAVGQLGGELLIANSTIGGQRRTTIVPCPIPGAPGCHDIVLQHLGFGVWHQGGALRVWRSAIVDSTLGIEPSSAAPGASITVGATVFQNNELWDCRPGIASKTPVVSAGYNLDEDGTCFDGTQPTDLVATAADLSPAGWGLGANGGPTATKLPASGSPVVDHIPGGAAFCDGSYPFDQRGLPRPANGACDIGPVEVQPPT